MSEFWDDSMIRDLASFLQLKINKKPEQDNRRFYLIINKRERKISNPIRTDI